MWGCDAHLEMLVTLLSFQTGSLPALSTRFPSSPQSAMTNLREWHAGVLHVVSRAVDTPGLTFMKGCVHSAGTHTKPDAALKGRVWWLLPRCVHGLAECYGCRLGR